MAENCNHDRPPLPLNYKVPKPKTPRNLLKTVGSFIAGFILGIFFIGCVSFNTFPNPIDLPVRAKLGIALLFGIAASMAVVLAVFALRKQPGEPQNFDDVFFAGFLSGTALTFFFVGSCYAIP